MLNIPKTMKAATLYGPQDLRIEDVPVPNIGAEEALIKVEVIGICPSDIKNYLRTDGKTWFPYGLQSYGLSGHEFVGKVIALGENVKNFSVGDVVVPEIIIPCGRCKFCKKGLINLCSNKKYISHGYAEYAKVNTNYLYKVPEGVPMEMAAFTEPLSVVLHTNSILGLRPDDTVLIVGAGPMGLLHLMVAKLSGAKVIVSEINKNRLEKAKELGADYVINPVEKNLPDEVAKITGYGADGVIVTIGNKAAIESGIMSAGPASTVAIFASAYPDIAININPNIIHWREVKITGSYEHMPYDMQRALDLMNDNKIDPMKIVTAQFNLLEISKAFEY
ncbi:MAG: zinc-dependent alcohol dehydrogenase, partial [Nitrososphaeria archaeon]